MFTELVVCWQVKGNIQGKSRKLLGHFKCHSWKYPELASSNGMKSNGMTAQFIPFDGANSGYLPTVKLKLLFFFFSLVANFVFTREICTLRNDPGDIRD